MPLFHSNAVQVGWAPSIVYGARVGLAREFSASRLAPRRPPLRLDLLQLHRQAARATCSRQPEQPDDADNPLRVAFGNEGSPEVVDAFARRFGVEVIDAYGATEGGVAVNRDAEERAGRARPGRATTCKVVDDDGNEKPPRAVRRRRPAR